MSAPDPLMSVTGPFAHVLNGRGVLRIDGNDTLDLINRLSSNKVDDLGEGQARETLFTNEKGRVIDAAVVLVGRRGARLLLSPSMVDTVTQWLDKYTIMEDCSYTDVSAMYAQVSIYNADQAPDLVHGLEYGLVSRRDIGGVACDLLRLDSVQGDQLRLLCVASGLTQLLDALASSGIPQVNDEAFTMWRISTLTPAVGHELSGLANPLESGAGKAVDFTKGCYIGQEVIARLDSYDKVQRTLCRLRWTQGGATAVPAGTALFREGRDAGFVTTHLYDAVGRQAWGLACVRIAFAQAGQVLELAGDEAARVLVLP
jgi:tRNA-modifying protein YgfZ